MCKVPYHIDVYGFSQLEAIRTEWQSLQSGQEMTYFQSYDWTLLQRRFFIHKPSCYEARIYVVHDQHGTALLIAPFLIIKKRYNIYNEPSVYLLAHRDWSDYANFIYIKFDPAAAQLVLKRVVDDFGGLPFCFEKVRQDTSLYTFLSESFQIGSDTPTVCVAATLPSFESDMKALFSKGTRQNIRTAYNRLRSDGHTIRCVFDDMQIPRETCLRLYETRIDSRTDHWFLKLKLRIANDILSYHFMRHNPIVDDRNSHILSIYIDGELGAFFNYGINPDGQSIVMMSAGMDVRYKRYSLGILALYEFYQYLIAETHIRIVDFTRGNEPYKYAVGGVEHYIHQLTFSL